MADFLKWVRAHVAIVAAAGLQLRDLYDDLENGAEAPRRGRGRPRLAVAATRQRLTEKQIAEWWQSGQPIAGTLAEAYLAAKQDIILRSPRKAGVSKDGREHYCKAASPGLHWSV